MPAEAPSVELLPTPEPAAGDAGETRGDVRVYTMTRARLRRVAGHGVASATRSAGQDESDPATQAGSAPAGSGTSAPTSPLSSPAPVEEPQAPAPAGSGTSAPTSPLSGPAPVEEPQAPAPVTAAKGLGLDITAPWPGAAEALRRLFATSAPATDAPADGFTYVAVPMPAGSGYDRALAGLKVTDGRITAVRHALPGRRAPEPPAGLDAYRWLPGDGENGFWVTEEVFKY